LYDLKQGGYRIVLFFLWLPSADVAVARVANRVRQGGHNIPEPIIRRRFEAGIRNLFQSYRPLPDIWSLYDASPLPPRLVVEENDGRRVIHEPETLDAIMTIGRTASDE
jgi:predicted ABC-type ATPase